MQHLKPLNKTYTVTRPFLPPLEEFIPLLKNIWESKNLTNNGEYHRKFELALSKHLDVPYVSLYTNGTLALMAALKALNLKGEVITTPYSFIATTHALWWQGLKPVFADIESESCNLSPIKAEEAIGPNTSAILPVHVYGNPCKTKAFNELTSNHGLKLIYDAAHAFDVGIKGKSLLVEGDLSVLSFHATKTFNTFEGGAVVCKTLEIKEKLDYIKNFGFADETTVTMPGINAKMNEFQAALGLLQLKYHKQALEERQITDTLYRNILSGVTNIQIPTLNPDVSGNYGYFPVFVDPDKRDFIYEKLKRTGIMTRRYFFPLITAFEPYTKFLSAKPENLPIANKLSRSVICLPLYNGLTETDIDYICKVFKGLIC